jgi:hypothetical protein
MLNHALAQITGFRAFDKKAVGPDQAGRMRASASRSAMEAAMDGAAKVNKI